MSTNHDYQADAFVNQEPFKFECPECGQRISATPDLIGTEANCPSCDVAITVRAPAPQAVAVPPATPAEAPREHSVPAGTRVEPRNKSGCLGLLFQFFGIATSPPARGPIASYVSAGPESERQPKPQPEPESKPLPFRLRDDFISPAEISFYHVLLSVVDNGLTVCPKVNLNDIFFVSRPDQNQAARNRISRKHVDFLLCDSRTMRPLVGIELDDSSHAREDRQARDAFVAEVFKAAGLTLLRFPVQRSYQRAEITSRLSPFLAEALFPAHPPVPPVMEDAASAPLCAKCGIPMVVRSGNRGQFYGCSNYPKCRTSKPILSAAV
jgi:hypothetical protein